jgi:AcrR family transcriptional regulator
MDGFERRKERSKEDIRRAAEELFSQFGADRVSINDIARKAGVSQATIYNNFGSKDELLRDYHNTIVRKIAGRFRGILLMKKSWIDRFQGFLQSWIDIADQYKTEVRRANALAGRGVKSEIEPTPVDDPLGKEIENAFHEFIREGKEQGGLRSEISDDAILAYISFFQQGISNNPGIRDGIRRDPKLSNDLLSLFMYGISGDPVRISEHR